MFSPAPPRSSLPPPCDSPSHSVGASYQLVYGQRLMGRPLACERRGLGCRRCVLSSPLRCAVHADSSSAPSRQVTRARVRWWASATTSALPSRPLTPATQKTLLAASGRGNLTARAGGGMLTPAAEDEVHAPHALDRLVPPPFNTRAASLLPIDGWHGRLAAAS